MMVYLIHEIQESIELHVGHKFFFIYINRLNPYLFLTHFVVILIINL